jgi:hypothetical protein
MWGTENLAIAIIWTMLLWKVDRTLSNCMNKQMDKSLLQLLIGHETHVDVGNVLNLDLF